MPPNETSPLEGVVAAWAKAWQDRKPAHLIALWDKSDAESWYLSASSVEPFLGNAVVGFIQRRCLNASTIGYQPSDLHLRRLAPDLGLAFFQLAWSEQTNRGLDRSLPIGGHVRVTMMMRQHAGVWSVFHYAEAPLAPLLELQAFYEAVAAEGLDRMPTRSFLQNAS